MNYCTNWGTDFSKKICVGTPEGFKAGKLSSLGVIIGELMPYIFAISGIILLFMIVIAGYSLLTSAGNPESIEKGKKRLTAGLVGFIIIFAAFWIWQLVAVFMGLGESFPEGP